MHVFAKLEDGTVICSSVNDNPFKFVLGRNEVTQGLEIGVSSMKVGENAIIHCEPSYAYGTKGFGKKIPPNSRILYYVVLLATRVY